MQFCTENVTAKFKSINLFCHRILIIAWQDAITESQSCYTLNSLIAASFTFGWCGNWNVESVNKLIPSFLKTEMCVDVMFDTKQIFSVFWIFLFLPISSISSSFFRKKLEEIAIFQFLPGVLEEIHFFRKKPNPVENHPNFLNFCIVIPYNMLFPMNQHLGYLPRLLSELAQIENSLIWWQHIVLRQIVYKTSQANAIW